ncbi:MAG: hypothetical protein LBT53_00090 [Puniceicoccales bacterium]|nr:hypothetical protein [Puniceicoccales bacterium]
MAAIAARKAGEVQRGVETVYGSHSSGNPSAKRGEVGERGRASGTSSSNSLATDHGGFEASYRPGYYGTRSPSTTPSTTSTPSTPATPPISFVDLKTGTWTTIARDADVATLAVKKVHGTLLVLCGNPDVASPAWGEIIGVPDVGGGVPLCVSRYNLVVPSQEKCA